MEFGDLKPVLDRIIEELKAGNRAKVYSPASDSAVASLSGKHYIKVTKTNGAGSVVITLPSGTRTLTADASTFELPVLPSGNYGDITIASEDGGTWRVDSF